MVEIPGGFGYVMDFNFSQNVVGNSPLTVLKGPYNLKLSFVQAPSLDKFESLRFLLIFPLPYFEKSINWPHRIIESQLNTHFSNRMLCRQVCVFGKIGLFFPQIKKMVSFEITFNFFYALIIVYFYKTF